MFSLSKISTTLSIKAGRTGLILKKASPEIALGLGIVGGVAATVMACKATLKLDEVLHEANEKYAFINHGHEHVDPEQYTEEMYRRDQVLITVQTGANILKLYGPSILVGVVSIGLIVGSHRILTKRNAGLAAAYKLLDEGYRKYRARVAEKVGEEEEEYLHLGMTKKEVDAQFKALDVEPKEGEEVAATDVPVCMAVGDGSIYAKEFNDTNIYWQRHHTNNHFFLRTQQNFANEMLNTRGHVFLNEIYDMLGMERTPAGSQVGWIKDSPIGDQVIDFNLLSPINKGAREGVRGRRVLPWRLDFNVDGEIWNLI